MTDKQAKFIMDKILPGFWPDWNCTDAQMRSWLRELKAFDFEKAKNIIESLHFTKAGTFKNPPARRLLDELKARATESPFAEHERGALLLYEIIPDGYCRGMKFYMASGKPNAQEQVIEEAERKSKHSHIIHYADWEAELERRKKPPEETPRHLTDDDRLRLQVEILDGPDRPAKEFLRWYLDRDARKKDVVTGHVREAVGI
jgi:hypothetical protein